VQTRIWKHVLSSLASYFGVPARIATAATCVDSGLRWSQVKNLKYNAQMRTLFNEPIFILRKVFGDHGDKEASPG
jgi:hypothetical protein